MFNWILRYGYYIFEIENFKISVSTKLVNESLIKYDAWLNQIHSDKIHIIDSKSNIPKGDIDGDGIILKVKSIKARIRTADCYPVVILDVKNQFGGIFHVGWRGSYLRILERAIKIFLKESNFKNIIVVFGPGICSNCYEIRENLFNYFPKEYFHYKNGKLFLDLLSFNLDILKSYGINNFVLPPSCTYEDPILYSHRRGEKSRIYTLLEIKEH
ncbi:MAG: polyphenol oxidase family protein [candidate division WOR-3 bacterium]